MYVLWTVAKTIRILAHRAYSVCNVYSISVLFFHDCVHLGVELMSRALIIYIFMIKYI